MSYRVDRIDYMSLVEENLCGILCTEYFDYSFENVLMLMSEKKGQYQDESFAVYFGRKLIAVIPLFLSRKEQEEGYFGRPTEVIYFGPRYEGFEKAFFKYLKSNSLSFSLFMDNSQFTFDYYEYVKAVSHYFFTTNTLRQDNLALRKTYRPLIRWGADNLNCEVIDGQSMTSQNLKLFTDFYEEVSCREFSSERWTLVRHMIERNRAFLVLGSYRDRLVSSTFSLAIKGNVVTYSLGAYDRSLISESCPVSHFPLYLSIAEVKKNGGAMYNLGHIQMDCQDKKSLDIFKFKKGFSDNIKLRCCALLGIRSEYNC